MSRKPRGAAPKASAEAKKRPGRPSRYTEAIGDEICERLANGESLKGICSEGLLPSMRTVLRWLADDENEGFRRKYAHAREAQADALADEMLEIADDATNDWMLRNREGHESWELNGEHIQRSRLRLDARKWLASKLAPKKYGDKIGIGGADDLPPIKGRVVQKIEWAIHDPTPEDSAGV